MPFGSKKFLNEVTMPNVDKGLAAAGRSRADLAAAVKAQEQKLANEQFVARAPAEIVDNPDVRKVYLGEHFRM